MNELEMLNRVKVELHQEQNQKIESKFIGNVILLSGRKLWCFDPDKNEIVEVKITNISTASFTDGMAVKNSKSQYNPSCLYFQAINKKNAWRKLSQYKSGNYSVAETFEKKMVEKLPQMF